MSALSQAFHDKAREIIARYPVKRSALIMLLHEAQDELGYVSTDAMRQVAALLDLSPADVAGVASFYTMFKRRPCGRYLVSLCTNPSCAINGADDTVDALQRIIGPPREVTDDGLCSWEEVECLATCAWAPSAQVNYRDVPYLTPERAERLVAALRVGRDLDAVLEELRRPASLAEARRDAANTAGSAG